MVEEKTEVNDTGIEEKEEEKEEQLPIIDPETGEVKEPESKTEEQGENWEKRYKDLQSHSDKTLAEKDKEIGKFKNLVSPFQQNVKTAEDGSLIFDFSDTSPSKEKGKKPPEEITEPDDDLWLRDPKAATKQQLAYDRQEEGKKATTEKAKQDAADRETQFKGDWDKSWEKTQVAYPDMAKADSELRKKADAILAENPGLASVANCNEIVANLAARELGISPKEVSEEAPVAKVKDTSYIIGSGTGTKGGSKGKKKLSEEEFAALSHDAQTEYMRKGFMEE